MKHLFWIIVLFSLAIAAALFAQNNHGYVLFVISPYRIEISLNFFIVSLVVLLSACFIIVKSINWLFNISQRVKNFQQQRRLKNAKQTLQEILCLLLENRNEQALIIAEKSYNTDFLPNLSALFAVQACNNSIKNIDENLLKNNDSKSQKIDKLEKEKLRLVELSNLWLDNIQKSLKKDKDNNQLQQFEIALAMLSAENLYTQQKYAEALRILQNIHNSKRFKSLNKNQKADIVENSKFLQLQLKIYTALHDEENIKKITNRLNK